MDPLPHCYLYQLWVFGVMMLKLFFLVLLVLSVSVAKSVSWAPVPSTGPGTV